MSYPKAQFILSRTRGSKTSYFYGSKLGILVRTHVKIGDTFSYAKLTTSPWRTSTRISDHTYATE